MTGTTGSTSIKGITSLEDCSCGTRGIFATRDTFSFSFVF
jgi:hypothetical protein